VFHQLLLLLGRWQQHVPLLTPPNTLQPALLQLPFGRHSIHKTWGTATLLLLLML
jgi:hypothetical protein